jgi:hypothetical protein
MLSMGNETKWILHYRLTKESSLIPSRISMRVLDQAFWVRDSPHCSAGELLRSYQLRTGANGIEEEIV